MEQIIRALRIALASGLSIEKFNFGKTGVAGSSSGRRKVARRSFRRRLDKGLGGSRAAHGEFPLRRKSPSKKSEAVEVLFRQQFREIENATCFLMQVNEEVRWA